MGVDATTMQTPTVVITPVPPIVADTKAAIATAVGVSDVSTPTLGSLLHGLLDDEGRLQCRPCAWFYKDSGCRNGASCRRCHLCPTGELKLRKKQRIAFLRDQEVAIQSSAPPSSTPSSAPSTSPPVARRPKGSTLTVMKLAIAATS